MVFKKANKIYSEPFFEPPNGKLHKSNGECMRTRGGKAELLCKQK